MQEQSRLQRRRARERDRQASRITDVLADKSGRTSAESLESPEQGQQEHNAPSQSVRTRSGHDFGQMDMAAEPDRTPSIAPAEGARTSDQHNEFATFSVADGQAPMLRDGMTLPGGAVMENVNVSASAIVVFLQNLAIQGGGGFGSNADFATNAGPIIDAAIGAMMNPRTLTGSFTETRGVNCNWTWRVSFKMGAPVEIGGGGTGGTTHNFGGSGQVSTSTQTSTTDSAKVTGSTKASSGTKVGENTSGSETGVGGEVGTSTTRTQTTGAQVTTQGGGSAQTQNVLRRFRAPVIVEAMTQGDLDMSGTDYINPFKWGMYAAEAADSIERKTGELVVGTCEYYRSEGIAPAAPAAPAARKGWVEHELGITEEGESNLAKVASALTVNPAELSRAGARPITPDLLGMDQDATRASAVNLIHGAQADAYCDAMSAAAFTTPLPGGGSDIFVHSGVDLASARGQHTLHHELAHAAQFQSGEGTSLHGLGGDTSTRSELERRADEAASRAVRRNAQVATVEPETQATRDRQRA